MVGRAPTPAHDVQWPDRRRLSLGKFSSVEIQASRPCRSCRPRTLVLSKLLWAKDSGLKCNSETSSTSSAFPLKRRCHAGSERTRPTSDSIRYAKLCRKDEPMRPVDEPRTSDFIRYAKLCRATGAKHADRDAGSIGIVVSC